MRTLLLLCRLFFNITMSHYFQRCQILITLAAARNHLSVKCEHEPIDAVILSGEDVLILDDIREIHVISCLKLSLPSMPLNICEHTIRGN